MSEILCVNELPRLLVLDVDESVLRQVRRVFLRNAVVTCFTSGYEALAWLSEHDCDIALMGERNANTDNATILKVIRKTARHGDLPVIALTDALNASQQAEGYALGVADFVLKPIVPEVLQQRVYFVLHYEYVKDHLKQEVGRQTRLADERLAFNKRLTREMTVALAKTIDAKDRYTSGHSERVAVYSRYIALHAGESKESQEEIYFAGLLHDIGKIGVPRRLINKPTRLTIREFRSIQSHTIIGASILQTIDVLPALAIAAHYHHERYDGQGYPQRLKGDSIPKLARIIAVADAYDAMTSKRSYRDILPQGVARSEIVKGKGLQFDPLYAEVMVDLIDRDKNYLLREGGRQV